MAKPKRGKKYPGGFIALPNIVCKHPAWKELSADARCLYIELKFRYNGSNNGFIGLSCREAAEVFHGGKDTARTRLKELQDHGFIKRVHKGHYQNRHATTWLLTTEPDDRNGHRSSDEWKQYVSKSRLKKKPSTSTERISTATGTTNHNQLSNSTH